MLVIVASAVVVYLTFRVLCFFRKSKVIVTEERNEWFGIGAEEETTEDVSVRPFQINIPESVLLDLKERLGKTRFEAPLQDAKFHYGFNSGYLQQVVKFWKDEFDWKKQEEKLNSFPHFKTSIYGLEVHFVHVKPELPPGSDLKVVPLLMVHGWPGSFLEFYKILPFLTRPSAERGFVFEVICPSIPGFGFSEAPHRKGFDGRAAARAFHILMQDRLGHAEYCVQGGDWGSFIVCIMARYYPNSVIGLHLNMFGRRPTGWEACFASILSRLPFLMSQTEYNSAFPVKKKAAFMAEELGYFHIQSTKPDTLGCAMSDSPAGLAAYILEKFSTWTSAGHRDLEDGGLRNKFTLDELLANVTLYWVCNNFASAARFYKENAAIIAKQTFGLPIVVPCGLALFPEELRGSPRLLVRLSCQMRDLVSYTVMPRGGHFAALEEPKLLAEDVWNFVDAVRKRERG